MLQEVVYALIGSHGLTDLYLPYDLWGPVYLISLIYSNLLPYKIVLGGSYLLSVLHFSQDISYMAPFFIRCLGYGTILAGLLRHRTQKWSQRAILGYLCLIHTPIHYMRYVTSLSEVSVMFIGGCICMTRFIRTYLTQIIQHGEIERATLRNRWLLSILNGHIITIALHRMG